MDYCTKSHSTFIDFGILVCVTTHIYKNNHVENTNKIKVDMLYVRKNYPVFFK